LSYTHSGRDKAYASELRDFLQTHDTKFWDYDASKREFEVDFIEELIAG
jgi:hypothetical protein